MMGLQYHLFDNTAGPWNGSVWTLEFEFFCYLLLMPIFYIPFIRRQLNIVIPVAFVVSVSYFFCNQFFGLEKMAQAFGLEALYLKMSARLYPLFLPVRYLPAQPQIRVYLALSWLCVVAGFYLTWLAPHVNVLAYTQLVLAYGIISLGGVLNTSWGRTIDLSYGGVCLRMARAAHPTACGHWCAGTKGELPADYYSVPGFGVVLMEVC